MKVINRRTVVDIMCTGMMDKTRTGAVKPRKMVTRKIMNDFQ